MAVVKFVALTLAVAVCVGVSVSAHSRMTSPAARTAADGGNNHDNPCGGFNSTGTNVVDFDINNGQVDISIGHGDTGDVYIRYWKRGDATAVDPAGVPPNGKDASAWTQVGYINVTVNPPAAQTIRTAIAQTISTAKVGDIGVLQMAVIPRNDADQGYACADIRLVLSGAADVLPNALLIAAAALFGAMATRRV